jgi:cyclopropane-fatty-acyl-phospholipid synthase
MGIAEQLRPIAVAMLGDPPPVALVFWDGSAIDGTSDDVTLRFRSRRALSHVQWGRGELGLARAYVTGELEVEGDLHHALRIIGEALTGREAARFTLAERAEMVKIAARAGIIGLRVHRPRRRMSAGENMLSVETARPSPITTT